MKKVLSVLIAFSIISITMNAQNSLPEHFSLMGGGGLSIAGIDYPDNVSISRPQVGYTLMGDARIYLSEELAVGARYDYMQTGNKLRVHNFGPEVALTFRQNDNHDAWTIALGLGCMNYQDKITNRDKVSLKPDNDYFFSISLSVEYDFHVGGALSGAAYISAHAADLFQNPNFRISNPYPDYDDGEYHGFFDCHKFFLNLGLAICIGR